jgi:ParG
MLQRRRLAQGDIGRYHGDMPRPTSDSDRTARLIEKALNGLPERDRAQVVRFLLRAWLDLRFGQMQPPGALEMAVLGAVPAGVGITPATMPMPVVASGPEHQTLLVRLPEEQHTALKAWCTDHGFSMATVVRGLVENFLRAQTPGGTEPGTD